MVVVSIFMVIMLIQVDINKCVWMLIVAVIMMPLCSFGSPADFWFLSFFQIYSKYTRSIFSILKVIIITFKVVWKIMKVNVISEM